MSRLDELPPDQHAALSLVLGQGKSYGEVAALLGIGEQAVHDRAHAALAVLAPRQAIGLDAQTRLEVGDYLLSQQRDVAQRLRTRTTLATSEPARIWAQAVAAELAPLARGGLPEIPIGTLAGQAHGASGVETPPPAPQWEAARPAAQISRTGGAILLALIVAAVVVAVVLLSGGGGSPSKKAISTGSTVSSTSSTSASGPKVEGKFELKAPDPSSKSTGSVAILSEGGKRAFYIQAERIPASKGFFYAIWLYNSPSDALPLSKSPAVGKTHKLAGAALLPSNASKFREILLTRETSARPTRPGHVVLRGPFHVSG